MFCFFFFTQKTAYEMRISDWSSDVCSSDLVGRESDLPPRLPLAGMLALDQAGDHRHVAKGALEQARLLDPLDEFMIQYVGRKQALRVRHLLQAIDEIGRASCRERVWQYV